MLLWIRRFAAPALIIGLLAFPAHAQSPQRTSTAPAGTLAEGWAALAKGDLPRAAAAADRAVAETPLDPAAASLAVEVELVRAGAMGALARYERWLAGRKVDAPYVLRSIATAHLQEIVRQRTAGAARLDALKALVADGDPVAAASLAAAGDKAGPAETHLMASLGNEGAVRALIRQLQAAPSKGATIKALADSGSPLAIKPLMDLLSSGNPDDRAAAADALARLGAEQAIDRIKPLFSEQNFNVRMAAAAALYRLGDNTGAAFLEERLTSEHSQVKLSAAEALSVRPGGAWLSVARTLTSDPDEAVRLGAARLVAPYDRQLAESVLDSLGRSGNLAIREEAGRTLAERVASDFATLRRLLHSSDGRTSVSAAARILELTR
ncbi:MAG TPA: HEAT repeat domain-containing protein [Vicinamibacterales bacterium]